MDILVKYYHIKSFKYNFYAMVRYFEENDMTIVSFGNPNKMSDSCVDLYILNDVVTLNYTFYNSKCSDDVKLEKGALGTVIMIKSAIEFVKKVFYPQELTTIILIDNSGFTDVHKNRIELSLRNYLLYGKTWYQQNFPEFNLKPEHPSDKELLINYNKHLKSPCDLKQLQKEVRKTKGKYIKIPSGCFTCGSGESWTDYFHKIKNTCPTHYFTSIMLPTVNYIWKLKSIHQISWKGILSKDPLVPIEYSQFVKRPESWDEWEIETEDFAPY